MYFKQLQNSHSKQITDTHKNFYNNLLGIFVDPVAGDEVTFKEMRPPFFHLGLAFTIQSTLLFFQQIFLIRCCRLITMYNRVAH